LPFWTLLDGNVEVLSFQDSAVLVSIQFEDLSKVAICAWKQFVPARGSIATESRCRSARRILLPSAKGKTFY
jgi:hypothetical protein